MHEPHAVVNVAGSAPQNSRNTRCKKFSQTPVMITSKPTRTMEANFTKASLIVPESRVVAGLLLDGVDGAEWTKKIVQENVLRARAVNTAKSYATVARHRLETTDADLWKLVHEGDRITATQATLVAALRFSPLLALFMRTALADEYRRMSEGLEASAWNRFFEDCAIDHQNLAEASPTTRSKLRQNAFRMLHEAGYVGPGPKRFLQHVRLEPEVRDYLNGLGDEATLSAMEVAR